MNKDGDLRAERPGDEVDADTIQTKDIVFTTIKPEPHKAKVL